MTTIWVATLNTDNFSFEAFHLQADEALRTLNHGLQRHCRLYRVDYAEFMQEYERGIEVTPRLVGGAYCDGHPL